jgi:hypothetical protein
MVSRVVQLMNLHHAFYIAPDAATAHAIPGAA